MGRLQTDYRNFNVDEIDPSQMPVLETEIEDNFKMTTVTIKFVAFKTPPIQNKTVLIPKRMKFTTKFYAFKEAETEYALLRLPKSVAKNMKQQETIENLN